MTELGWNSIGVLELTALPSMQEERWASWVRGADVLLVDGGDATYPCHWMRQPGLLDFSIFPHLDHEQMPDHNLANAERWAVDTASPAYPSRPDRLAHLSDLVVADGLTHPSDPCDDAGRAT